MQLTAHSLLAFTAATSAISAGATPAAVVSIFSRIMSDVILAHTRSPGGLQSTHAGVVSLAEMKAWVDAQDPANITLLGDPFAALRSPLALRADNVLNTVTVTFCSTRINDSACAAPCTTITSGGAACINAPGTNCLFATHDLAFCNGVACQGICNVFGSCGVVLQGGFCSTPGTLSISVPAVTSD